MVSIVTGKPAQVLDILLVKEGSQKSKQKQVSLFYRCNCKDTNRDRSSHVHFDTDLVFSGTEDSK